MPRPLTRILRESQTTSEKMRIKDHSLAYLVKEDSQHDLLTRCNFHTEWTSFHRHTAEKYIH